MDRPRWDRHRVLGVIQRRSESERPMRAMAVIVLHAVEMPASEDEHPVQALRPDGLDPSFVESVRVRCADRGEDHLGPLRPEDLVE
jgi:hypothetical protein